MMSKSVRRYLDEHGDLCVGKFAWPRDVTEEDRQSGSNDALQMPVLERLGLVESTQLPVAHATGTAAEAIGAQSSAPLPAQLAPTKRYSLTPKGRQYYLQKRMTSLGAHEQPSDHDGDFCVAHLSLDKVVKWTPPERVNGHLQTEVAFTYHIKPADWTADPEVRKVFPRVDMAIRGEGSLQLNETFALEDGRWVPVLPGR